MTERHVVPSWQDHVPSPRCWCQPRPEDVLPAGRLWLHRTAHDDPHVYPAAADPALRAPGRRWLLVPA